MGVVTLATKYRPKTFDEVVAQDSIKTILGNQLKTGTFKNAYLFTGSAGTGKTTTARIFANELNNHMGNPIEIDGASNNGVDNVRTIIEDAKRKSLDSEYKVYIIDECHMISTAGWNAMLKLIEEPPKGTVFIFCTTDPQKIPNTILSRVQRYDFTKIPTFEIADRLKYILKCEKIDIVTDEIVDYIARLANGGMRNAITMLDKVLSSNDYSMANTIKLLGKVEYDVMFNLIDKLDYKNLEFVEIIETLEQDGKDLKQFISQFSNLVIDIIKYRISKTLQFTNLPDLPHYRDMMEDLSSGFLSSLLRCVLDINRELKYSDNPKYIIEGELISWVLEN